jgi:hypothetical protein
LLIFGIVCLASIAVDMVRSDNTFRMTSTHLKVSTWFGRFDIPWTGVRRIRRLPKRWWAMGGGEAEFDVIEGEDYREVRYMPHLLRDYPSFIEELKRRAPGFHGFDAHGSRLFPE